MTGPMLPLPCRPPKGQPRRRIVDHWREMQAAVAGVTLKGDNNDELIFLQGIIRWYDV